MRTLCAYILTFTLLAGCVTVPEGAVEPGDIYDPHEKWNRKVFAFNERVDKAILEPMARTYRNTTPKPVREALTNVLNNLYTPVIFVNDVVQLRPARATKSVLRFSINTTVGVLGIVDVAYVFGLPYHEEDFGQTLAMWGVGCGVYIMWPVVGPSCTRDTFGAFLDDLVDPANWVRYETTSKKTIFATARVSFNTTVTREEYLEVVDQIRKQPDPYIAARRAWLASRNTDIYDRPKTPEEEYEDLPDFDDFDDF